MGIVVLVGIGYGGWYLGQNQKSNLKNPMPTGRQENDNVKLKNTETPITQTPTTPSTSVNSQPSTVTVPDPTADWKTYENKDYGFSFKYPGDWTFEEPSRNSPNFLICKVSDQCIVIWLNVKNEPNLPLGVTEISRSNINVGNVTGARIKLSNPVNGNRYQIFITKDNAKNAYDIYLPDETPETFNQILSTFRFTK